MLCNVVLHNVLLHNVLLHNVVLCNAVLCNVVLCNVVLCNVVLHNVLLHNVLLWIIVVGYEACMLLLLFPSLTGFEILLIWYDMICILINLILIYFISVFSPSICVIPIIPCSFLLLTIFFSFFILFISDNIVKFLLT